MTFDIEQFKIDLIESLSGFNEEEKCDIIDIANKEMENLDIGTMDEKYRKALVGKATQLTLELINEEQCTEDDIKHYMETINDRDILDIRVSNKKMYIKTVKLAPVIVAHILQIDDEYIEKVPINGKYDFYVIDTKPFARQIVRNADYDPENLVEALQKLGEGTISDDIMESILDEIIVRAFSERLHQIEEVYSRCNVENQVLAIGINKYIPDAKNVIGAALKINPKLFIEVSGFGSTVLLIDTKRWVLDPAFGDEEWYL